MGVRMAMTLATTAAMAASTVTAATTTPATMTAAAPREHTISRDCGKQQRCEYGNSGSCAAMSRSFHRLSSITEAAAEGDSLRAAEEASMKAAPSVLMAEARSVLMMTARPAQPT